MKRAWVVALTSATLGLALAGCSRPEPPEKDQPPEPTAEQMPTPAAAAADYAGSSVSAQMHDPIDRAKAVEATVLDAAEQQRAQIDAQTSDGATQPEQ